MEQIRPKSVISGYEARAFPPLFRKGFEIDASVALEYPFGDNVLERPRVCALFSVPLSTGLSTRNAIVNLVFRQPSYIIALIPL